MLEQLKQLKGKTELIWLDWDLPRDMQPEREDLQNNID